MAAQLKATAPLKAQYVAAVALDGIEEAVVRLKKDLSEMGRKEGASDAVVLAAEAHKDFWLAYRDIVDQTAKTHSNVVSLKSNFALSQVVPMMSAFEADMKEAGLDGSLFCRAGNGILYAVFPLGDNPEAKMAVAAAMIGKLTAEAVKNGGNLIVERAPRMLKEKVNVWGQMRSDVVVIRRLKEKLDPAGVLNPGRYVGGV